MKTKFKTKPYYYNTDGWTKIYNTMFWCIENPSAFKVYCYLCYRYNDGYQYAFPSISTIAKDCKLSSSTVQRAIKELEKDRLVIKYKKKGSENWNNCYWIFYVVDELSPIAKDKKERTKIETIVEDIKEAVGDKFYLDDEGNIVWIEDDNQESNDAYNLQEESEKEDGERDQ